MMAIAELARRRPVPRTPAVPAGEFPAELSEFIGDEVAAALTLSARAADAYLDLALDLATRLPGTAQALRAGVIDYLKGRLIADATRILTDADALAVESRILPQAGHQTLGQLRAAVGRAILAVDLDALLGQDSTPVQSPTPARPEPAQRRLAALLNLTVPLTTLLALGDEPGSMVGFGPLDASLARDLAALAANHPASRCCLTVTGDDGHPLGHGCARGQPPHLGQPLNFGQEPPHRPGPFTVTINPLAQGPCDHRHQEPGYQPSRQLRHLIWARNPTCSAPGCCRPATQCDLDHTVPYDQGGRTCECDLAPPTMR